LIYIFFLIIYIYIIINLIFKIFIYIHLNIYKTNYRLEETAELVDDGGCTVHRGSEAYTSKMCGCCGRLNEKLGSNRIYACKFDDCPMFGEKFHRDGDAGLKIIARSILEVTYPYPKHPIWSKEQYQSNKYKDEVYIYCDFFISFLIIKTY